MFNKPETSYTLTALKRTCKSLKNLIDPCTDQFGGYVTPDFDLERRMKKLSLKIAKK